ncbi:hypothetical protein INQ10_23440, partial [Escherichia coli]
ATLAATPGGAAGGDVTIDAGAVRLLNATGAADGCATAGLCGQAANLNINATTLSLGANAVRATGITAGVTLAARDGIYVEGKGSFSTGNAALTLQA